VGTFAPNYYIDSAIQPNYATKQAEIATTVDIKNFNYTLNYILQPVAIETLWLAWKLPPSVGMETAPFFGALVKKHFDHTGDPERATGFTNACHWLLSKVMMP